MKTRSRYQEVKMLSATGVFALVLGLFSMKNFVIPPEQIAQAVSQTNRSPANAQDQGQSSGQSSGQTTSTSSLAKLNESSSVVVEWNCKENFTAPTLSASHVRLKSHFCDKQTAPRNLKVANDSNGYTASVFLGAKDFSTDFIELKEGTNDIRISWSGTTGTSVTKTLRLVRAPGSAPATSKAVKDAGSH